MGLERNPREAFQRMHEAEEADRREHIARLAHDVNRAYCEALGDHSQPPWEHAPEWQRESARAGVAFHLDGDHAPDAGHQEWMRRKIADGWTLGPVKDPQAKTHPCLVPYYQLPVDQRAKDHIFRAIVHAHRPPSSPGTPTTPQE